MSEVTRKEMLDWIENIRPLIWENEVETKRDTNIYQAIRRLIEHGPEVSKRFVNEFASYIMEQFSYWIARDSSNYQLKRDAVVKEINRAFRMAGMRVKEEK